MPSTCTPTVEEEILDEEILETDETGTPVDQEVDEWGPSPDATDPSGQPAAPSAPAQQGTVTITRSAVVSPAAPGGILTPASPGMTVPTTQPVAVTTPAAANSPKASRLVGLAKLLYRAARDSHRWIARRGRPLPPRASIAEIQQELRNLGSELAEAQALNSRLRRRIELLLVKTGRG